MKGLLAAGSGRGLGEPFEWCGDELTFGDHPNSISATACLGGGKRRSINACYERSLYAFLVGGMLRSRVGRSVTRSSSSVKKASS